MPLPMIPKRITSLIAPPCPATVVGNSVVGNSERGGVSPSRGAGNPFDTQGDSLDPMNVARPS
jgi:hypothetical protein